VTLQAVLTGRATNPWTQAPVFGFEVSGAISRSAYGMGMFPAALSDEVGLRIAAELTQSRVGD
jgi:polyisoprenoid-binding protein YceI